MLLVWDGKRISQPISMRAERISLRRFENVENACLSFLATRGASAVGPAAVPATLPTLFRSLNCTQWMAARGGIRGTETGDGAHYRSTKMI
jgi:hypothetical protein